MEGISVNDINRKVVLEKDEEMPILKLSLKRSCADYQNVMQILPRKYYDKVNLLKWYIVISGLYIILTFSDFIKNVSNPDNLLSSLTTMVYLITIIIIYVYFCIKKQRQPFMKSLSKIFIKYLSILYRGRSINEIKRIIIPYELIFYETYITEKAPSLKDAKKVAADKIIDLPISVEGPKIKYSSLKNINENDNYISFNTIYFIAKKQLNENEKGQIDEILKELSQS